MQSVHDGGKHSCEYCDYKETTKGKLQTHMQSSMMELNIIVSIVTINQLEKAACKYLCNLSMIEFNIVMSVVTIKELQKASYKNMYNLSMKELNIVVNIVTLYQLQKATFKPI